MNRKLLVICGPTATGKTKLALALAKKFYGILLSADSRQVYKHMRIGTGRGGEKILGYDLVEPGEKFSVSQYLDFANKAIDEIQERGKLPILVGGTGLYIKAVVDGIGTANIKPDEKLRSTYAKVSADKLFEMLKKLDIEKAESMNESDRKNPRRLIRAIEIARQFTIYNLQFTTKRQYDVLWVGLIAPLEVLKERIGKRVDERVKNGFSGEVEYLKKNGFWDGVPKVTLGYREWPDIHKWKLEEFKYAKRQTTWFRKERRVNWFDATDADYAENVEKLVKKWYIKANAKEN